MNEFLTFKFVARCEIFSIKVKNIIINKNIMNHKEEIFLIEFNIEMGVSRNMMKS